MRKERKAISNQKEEQNERSWDRCFQREKHGGCPPLNSDLPEPLYPTIAIFMFGPIKFRFIKIQAGLFQNLIPLAIILIEEIYQR